VTDLQPDSRTRRVHYDWMEAGEHTQRTVAALSQQLRRFLDDQAWLENRRIMDILHGIESKALALRDTPPLGNVMEMAEAQADIELAMERPLFTPAIKPVIADLALLAGDEDIKGTPDPPHPPCLAGPGADQPERTGGRPAFATGAGRVGGLSATGQRQFQRRGG